MKYMGIDYGLKRVGVALSDEEGKIAFPFAVLENNIDLINNLLKIVVDKKVEAIVLGESSNFHGEPNKIMGEVKIFARDLEEGIELPIHYEPEFLTSFQAEKTQYEMKGDRAALDASAAAIILQSFLDKTS